MLIEWQMRRASDKRNKFDDHLTLFQKDTSQEYLRNTRTICFEIIFWLCTFALAIRIFPLYVNTMHLYDVISPDFDWRLIYKVIETTKFTLNSFVAGETKWNLCHLHKRLAPGLCVSYIFGDTPSLSFEGINAFRTFCWVVASASLISFILILPPEIFCESMLNCDIPLAYFNFVSSPSFYLQS